MYFDIKKLQSFYQTPLGQVVQSSLDKKLRALMQDCHEERILGLGYTLPYLDAIKFEKAERLLAFMPARLGVMAWPPNEANRTALVDEANLPLKDATLDIVLLIHGLEFSTQPELLMEEIWRVLAPKGHLIVVVPNRRGIWASSDSTPFGQGNPLSRSQLRQLLEEAHFDALAWDEALFFPPMQNQLNVKLTDFTDIFGQALWPIFSGVLLTIAQKQLYPAAPKKRHLLHEALEPIFVPKPQSAQDMHK